MQNIIVLVEPSAAAWDISWKAANMILNRFCIDEDASFESSGVYSLPYRNDRRGSLNTGKGLQKRIFTLIGNCSK